MGEAAAADVGQGAAQRRDHLPVAGDAAEDRHGRAADVAGDPRGVRREEVGPEGQPDGELAEAGLELDRPRDHAAGVPRCRPERAHAARAPAERPRRAAGGGVRAHGGEEVRRAGRQARALARADHELGGAHEPVGDDAGDRQPPAAGEHQVVPARARRTRAELSRQQRAPRAEAAHERPLRRGQHRGVAARADHERVERDREPGADGRAPVARSIAWARVARVTAVTPGDPAQALAPAGRDAARAADHDDLGRRSGGRAGGCRGRARAGRGGRRRRGRARRAGARRLGRRGRPAAGRDRDRDRGRARAQGREPRGGARGTGTPWAGFWRAAPRGGAGRLAGP